MTDNEANSEPAYGRLIREAKEQAFHARRKLRREQPRVNHQTKLEAATALADYQDVLQDYAGERALELPWQERLPVDLDKLLTQTIRAKESVPSRNPNACTTTEMPAVVQLNAQDLIQLAKELDSIAKELGFAADAKQPTPHEEASMSDLRGLLKARGQDAALDNLPTTEADSNDNEGASPEALPDGGEAE